MQKGAAKVLGLTRREAWIYIKIVLDRVFVNSSWEKVSPAQYTTSQREEKQSQKTTPISHLHSPQVKLQATENQIALSLKPGLPRGCLTHQSDNGYASLNFFFPEQYLAQSHRKQQEIP